MSLQNANKVIFFAAKHRSFRANLRSAPKAALVDYASDLNLDKHSVSIEELDAILGFSDADYASFEQLIDSLNPDMDIDDARAGVVL
jgi:hypothetical protein